MAAKTSTKRLLADCLKEMMVHKSVDKIAIQDLTTHLGLNRQTFYYHFTDIYDLLKWTWQQEALQLLQEKDQDLLWKEGILELFYYLEKNRAFAISTVNSLGIDHFKRFFYGEIYDIIGSVIAEFGEALEAEKAYMDFMTHYYTLSLPTIAISWLQGEIDNTPEEIIEMIDITFKDQLEGARMRFLREKKQ